MNQQPPPEQADDLLPEQAFSFYSPNARTGWTQNAQPLQSNGLHQPRASPKATGPARTNHPPEDSNDAAMVQVLQQQVHMDNYAVALCGDDAFHNYNHTVRGGGSHSIVFASRGTQELQPKGGDLQRSPHSRPLQYSTATPLRN